MAKDNFLNFNNCTYLLVRVEVCNDRFNNYNKSITISRFKTKFKMYM